MAIWEIPKSQESNFSKFGKFFHSQDIIHHQHNYLLRPKWVIGLQATKFDKSYIFNVMAWRKTNIKRNIEPCKQ